MKAFFRSGFIRPALIIASVLLSVSFWVAPAVLAERNVMTSSVRTGGRAEHILEEMGHSLFANCMRANADPFGLFKRIYQTPMNAGGLNANNMPGCIGPFDDCRDPEHFFLQLIKRYRLHGDDFRDLINSSPDASIRNRRRAQYLWLKQHWYRGAEFKTGQGLDPITKITDGLLCLPGECSLRSEPAPRSWDSYSEPTQV
jgi:hypothetical protein